MINLSTRPFQNWLSILCELHPILKVSSKPNILSTFQNIHQRMQQNEETFQLLSLRQNDFFILIGKELRYLNLSQLDQICQKEQKVSIILALTPFKVSKN